MQKVFNITNKYIILATPLILYSFLSTIYMVISASSGKIINLIFAIILFLLMTGAFISGWFNMIKLAVSNFNDENPNNLIKEFPSGVGEYFLSSTTGLLIMIGFGSLLLSLSYSIGIHYIGEIGISADTLAKALQSTSELKTFVYSLTPEQLEKMNLWNMLILGTISLVNYLLILYFPTIFFKSKNPFIAFFISIKALFSKKILKTTSIFILIYIINFLISIFSALFGNNAVMHFVLTLINFYFITIVGVGIFYYYYENFVKILIGKNVDIEI